MEDIRAENQGGISYCVESFITENYGDVRVMPNTKSFKYRSTRYRNCFRSFPKFDRKNALVKDV